MSRMKWSQIEPIARLKSSRQKPATRYVIVYPSNCDDIGISNCVIVTRCYGTMVTMLSWYLTYNSEHRPR